MYISAMISIISKQPSKTMSRRDRRTANDQPQDRVDELMDEPCANPRYGV